MDNLTKRLDYLAQLIQTAEFLERRGLGNELAFYILDYEPSQELRVRSFIQYLATHSTVRIAAINLYGALLGSYALSVTYINRSLRT